ncbi:hypothetical protein [Burkholderia ubonensis]|uniref:hypothetical protein n=1 Tax=Burkholderia ubonensis TaxID=101571 RepID=UPI00075ABA10|nr:hypothetical protein [Burkholderia ubonensis]KVG77209.1 hypothetical protein WJ34_02255 [Burkholderia ubonensis]KVH15805.1 hypothetical protein WJ37_31230 [Burkholderia ubonensis]KVH53429.1 hypothetical protein WJ38_02885 [Burkholderia ubonensis]KVH82341.1 hypothetical protein WJ43_26200 [Burkholderia ubonensis]KVM28990.1 hypothetical protein WJ55_23750 [Burkholderia ubonensis]
MDFIFNSTRQALHVSFLILASEPRAKNVLRTALIRAMELEPELSSDQRQWLEQLMGSEANSIVNFSGLDMAEVRAQCAAVVSAVRTKLIEAERWAVLARFGQMGDVRDEEGVKRFFFLPERADAIRSLSRWLSPTFPGVSMLALDCLLARLYANHAKATISFRDLARQFGASHMTYKRVYEKVEQRMREVEALAVNRLAPYFEETGLTARTTELV